MTNEERLDHQEDAIRDLRTRVLSLETFIDGHAGKLGVSQKINLLWSTHFYFGYVFAVAVGFIIRNYLHW
jgi:hypothetical protein